MGCRVIQLLAQNNLVQPASAPSFAPTDVSGLQLWLDAADPASFVLDVSGNIISWFDKSPNVLFASQTSILNRPTYYTNQLNGKASVRGNGSSHFMTIDSFPSLANGYTIYGVFQSPDSSGPCILASGSISMNSALIYCALTEGDLLGLSQFGAKIGQARPAENTNLAMMAKYDGSHTTGNYRVRLTTQASDTTGTMTQANSTPAASTMNVLRVDNVYGAYWPKNLYEVMIWNRETTAGEDASIKAYITSKWGLTWS